MFYETNRFFVSFLCLVFLFWGVFFCFKGLVLAIFFGFGRSGMFYSHSIFDFFFFGGGLGCFRFVWFGFSFGKFFLLRCLGGSWVFWCLVLDLFVAMGFS